MKLTLSRHIAASPQRVWEILSDLDAATENLPGVSALEWLDGPAYDVGTRWRETRTVFGRATSEDMEVISADPPRSTEIRAESAGIEYLTRFVLTEVGEETLLTMDFTGAYQDLTPLKKLITAVTAPLGASVTRKMMRQDLDAIAAAAEAAETRTTG